jgi:hypothetical protein
MLQRFSALSDKATEENRSMEKSSFHSRIHAFAPT